MKSNSHLLALLLSLSIFLLSGCSSNSQAAVSTTRKYSPQELKQDLKFMVSTDEQVHPDLYVHTTKAVFDSAIARAQMELDTPMTSLRFYEIIASVESSLRDGHTFISFPYQFRARYLKNGGRIIPFDVRIEGNRIFTKDNYSSDSTLAPNSEILSINGITAGKILKTLRPYSFGEFESLRNYEIGLSFKPYVWAICGFDGPFVVKYISSVNDRHYTGTLSGVTSSGWDSLSEKQSNTQEESSKWEFRTLSGGTIALIDMRSFGTSRDLDSFRKFLDSSFAEIKKSHIENLIIDLRNNGGGESKLAEALIDFVADKPWVISSRVDWKMSKQAKAELVPWYLRWIPIRTVLPMVSFLYTSAKIKNIESDPVDHELLHVSLEPGKLKNNPLRFGGHIYVLINRGSFSTSVLFAAVMKDYHFATLIGEETGQSADPFGGNYWFTLPNTHLTCSVPTSRSYRPDGQVTESGIVPDYKVRPDSLEMKNGADAVMKFTEELIAKTDSTHEVSH